MNQVLRTCSLGLLLPAAIVLSLLGCHKEGHAEKTGEKIDNTLGTGDDLSKGPFQKSGESIDNAADQTKPDKPDK